MELEHPELSTFEPVLRHQFQVAHNGGLSELEKKGYRFRDVSELRHLLLNPAAFRHFIRGCHYGYDRAQRQVGDLVIDLETQIRDAADELRKFRMARDTRARGLFRRIEVLRCRQVVLRRLIDSILYTIVGARTWVIRRFLQEYQIRPVNPATLKGTIELASDFNRQDRMSFNLVSDLTTVVQIGDLVSINITGLGQAEWRLIEIKEGRVNEILSGVIEKSGGNLTSDDHQLIKTVFGDHGIKQAQRMIRQQSRMTEVHKILQTDRGIDPLLKREIRITPDSVELDDCHEAVHRVWDKARKNGIGVAVVDGCLRFVATSAANMKILGHMGVAHLFYHLANPDKVCSLPDPQQSENEVEALKSVPLFVDLIEHNMKGQLGCPLFVWKEEQAVLDLLAGRIRIFIQFDLERFFLLAEAENIKMTWVRGKDADELKGISRRIPGSPDAWGIRAELPDGSIQTLLLGFVGRAIVDLTPPRELLRLVKRYPEQVAKMVERERQSCDPQVPPLVT